MADDGFTSAAESRRLEAEADALLKEDAKQGGFIRDNGRGYSAYARSIGITSKKILETTYAHEKFGFEEWQIESLAVRRKDKIGPTNG